MRKSDKKKLQTWYQWSRWFRHHYIDLGRVQELRRQCLYRELQPREDVLDYFDDKESLQPYVFPQGTEDRDLIEDIMKRMPEEWQLTFENAMTSKTIMEGFRHVLFRYGSGLKKPYTGNRRNFENQKKDPDERKPQSTQQVNNHTSHTNRDTGRRTTTREFVKTVNKPSVPSQPCYHCKGMHWSRDCPDRKTRTSIINAPSQQHLSPANAQQLPLNRW
ncbi:hypothetical protein QFC21_002593 [Naganishia friedmannii]|uniref:Uncharacterized protein n=1 Tax=Naganishia friedmannii TaxID=89922 RepID=A0ACC2VWK8_9TREE|nr:hypothetical protein QFC21_002593 [Naganishia friedmannii]